MRRLRGLLVLALAAILAQPASAAPTEVTEERPISVTRRPDGTTLLDFGTVEFGNLSLRPDHSPDSLSLLVEFAEGWGGADIDRHPPGAVRYARVEVMGGGGARIVAPKADRRNTTPPAVLTPSEDGVLLPFRWVVIHGWKGPLDGGRVLRCAVTVAGWRDDAAQFECSDPMLNRVWQLCHHTIKATTFAGVFVDGDRERLSYEADADLNQLGYYACNPDPRMPRDTFERLMEYPTWPSEWALHMVFIAAADWRQNADRNWLAAHYPFLKGKLLDERLRPDGLIGSNAAQIRKGDLVDWPAGERDGFVFSPVNSVVNAFHVRALACMAELARALDRTDEAAAYERRYQAGNAAFQRAFFDPARSLYRDGLGIDHASAHANLFPLALGIVPASVRPRVAAWLVRRGMVCSVYAAQYLLQGLFEAGCDSAALGLITAPGDRSWRHMVNSGATLTWEAWDQRFKPNQDWNHAWGAAPANLLPRFVLGVQPAAPGWGAVLVEIHPGSLTWAQGVIPSPHGPIAIAWRREPRLVMTLRLPVGVAGHLVLPASRGATRLLEAGDPVPAERTASRWILNAAVKGYLTIEEQ